MQKFLVFNHISQSSSWTKVTARNFFFQDLSRIFRPFANCVFVNKLLCFKILIFPKPEQRDNFFSRQKFLSIDHICAFGGCWLILLMMMMVQKKEYIWIVFQVWLIKKEKKILQSGLINNRGISLACIYECKISDKISQILTFISNRLFCSYPVRVSVQPMLCPCWIMWDLCI